MSNRIAADQFPALDQLDIVKHPKVATVLCAFRNDVRVMSAAK